MASSEHHLSEYNPEEIPNAEFMKFGIVVSEYNGDITIALRDGCVETLLKHGTKEENINVEYVPGAFELTSAALFVLQSKRVDAVICLGCVIKGETQHDEYINHAVAQGLTNLSLNNDRPVILGLLTPNNKQQALDRAGGKYGNKGVEAAIAAIKMAALRNKLSK